MFVCSLIDFNKGHIIKNAVLNITFSSPVGIWLRGWGQKDKQILPKTFSLDPGGWALSVTSLCKQKNNETMSKEIKMRKVEILLLQSSTPIILIYFKSASRNLCGSLRHSFNRAAAVH